jgi:delta14-sterol reductase
MDIIAGFFAPWAIYTLILLLHLLLPARRVTGYVSDERTGQPMRYRLNGPLVLLVMVAAWFALALLRLLPADWLYRHRWATLAGSVTLGLVLSIALVVPEKSQGRGFLTELYLGRACNRQFVRGRVDAKMFLYLVGAVMLALNVLSFTAHHLAVFGPAASPGVLLNAALSLWFVTEYLIFENVHLYTYDIFAERVGFKLVWGCFAFYPFFYAIGLWAATDLPNPGTPLFLLVLCVILFFAGWTLTRGANMQKYIFKTRPERAFLGIQPRALSDGRQTLLCSGFWGVARHVNYLGEILQAVAVTLVLGMPGLWLAWLYPLYYVALLFPRERADERRCSAKYGGLWAEYERKVPRRIVPGIY